MTHTYNTPFCWRNFLTSSVISLNITKGPGRRERMEVNTGGTVDRLWVMTSWQGNTVKWMVRPVCEPWHKEVLCLLTKTHFLTSRRGCYLCHYHSCNLVLWELNTTNTGPLCMTRGDGVLTSRWKCNIEMDVQGYEKTTHLYLGVRTG
jgi:hypothetical protein